MLSTIILRSISPAIARGSLSVSYLSSLRSMNKVVPKSFRTPTNAAIRQNHNLKTRGHLQSSSKSNKESMPIDSVENAQNEISKQGTFLQRYMGHKEIPPRNTAKWYLEMALISTVFAITGTSTMLLVRPAVSEVLGLKGSMKDGPWSYRISSLIIMTPLYAINLVLIGTLFGRHFYFRHFAVKMFSRFGIPPELMDKNFHQTAKNFRKW